MKHIRSASLRRHRSRRNMLLHSTGFKFVKIKNLPRAEYQWKGTRNKITSKAYLGWKRREKTKQPSPRQRLHGVYRSKIWNRILDITHLAHLNRTLGSSYSWSINRSTGSGRRSDTHIAIATRAYPIPFSFSSSYLPGLLLENENYPLFLFHFAKLRRKFKTNLKSYQLKHTR